MFHVSGRCDARTVPTCPEGHHCSSLSRCTNLDSVTGSYFYKDIRNFRNQPLFKRSDGMFFNFWRKWKEQIQLLICFPPPGVSQLSKPWFFGVERTIVKLVPSKCRIWVRLNRTEVLVPPINAEFLKRTAGTLSMRRNQPITRRRPCVIHRHGSAWMYWCWTPKRSVLKSPKFIRPTKWTSWAWTWSRLSCEMHMRLAAACIAAPQMCIAKANARITLRINNPNPRKKKQL